MELQLGFWRGLRLLVFIFQDVDFLWVGGWGVKRSLEEGLNMEDFQSLAK